MVIDKYRSNLILVTILIPFFILFINQIVKYELSGDAPIAQAGVLNLQKWDFTKNDLVKLDGEWNYYEGDYLSLDEMRHASTKSIKVPSLIKGKGKGTYHLQVKLPKSQTIYGLKIKSIRTAHALYLDEQFLGGNDPTKDYTARNTPYSTFFYADKNSVDIILQVGNKDFVDMGIAKPIYLGTAQAITSLQSTQYGLNLGLIAVLMLFGIYYLVIYANRKNHPFFLYSGLYFLIMAVSIGFGGEKMALQLFPEIPFQLERKINDLFGFSTVIIFIVFIKRFGFQMKSIKGFPLTGLPIAFYIFLIIFFPYSVYSTLQYWMWGYVWLLMGGFFINLIYLLLKNQLNTISKNELVLIFLAFCSLVLFLGMEIFSSIFPITLFNEIWMFFFIVIIFIFIAIKTANDMNLLEQAKDEAIQTKISFLNLQIKPHFIYNAISNIISLCYTDGKKAAQVLSKFSTYLRLILENNQQNMSITFQKELELIRAYVEVEKTRLNDQIDIHFSIDDTVRHLLIPSLSIQPFVENAIQHGLFHKPSNGNVSISATVENDFLKIIIEDDGIGMSSEQVYQLENALDKKGVGIQNAQARLKLMAGAHLKISSTLGKGTTVVIHLPIKLDRKEG